MGMTTAPLGQRQSPSTANTKRRPGGGFTAVFLAEVRTARRLARTWVIGILAVATTCIGYLYFAALHASMSNVMSSVVTSPRFLVDSFGGYLLWFLMASAVFLGFDIGSREQRDRIADAFDTRPVSNIELLAGRLAGVVATLAVPVVGFLVVSQGVGALGQAFDWPIRATFEPLSLGVFLAVDALPALVLWVAIVFLLAATLRSRLAVAVAAFSLLALALWGLSRAPNWLVEYVAFAPDRLVSDLVAAGPGLATIVQRLAVAAVAAGALIIAALCLARPDTGSRVGHLLCAAVLLGVGAFGIAAVVVQAHADLGARAHWRTVHESVPGAAPDIRSVAGQVHIDPGRALNIDVSLTVALAGEAALWFRFNPGMATREVLVDGTPVAFEHRDGLLSVDLPADADDEATVTVRADGIPDPEFAYLDSAIDFRKIAGANPLKNLGTEASLFERGYVALMPAVHWLPGTLTNEPSRRGFATVDLEVQVPQDWLVAGSGRRESLGGGRYRFAPEAPVTQVALLAAKFERYATTIDGVELELLLNGHHIGPVGYFSESAEGISEALADVLRDAEALGLPYPFDALRLVEVPAPLRGYGGGWRMETTLALPGMLLLRERGFPTAYFGATRLSTGTPPATEKLNLLRSFFREDRHGADPFAGFARNLFLHQTGARGSAAVAVEYLCQALASRLIGDADSYFSAHIYALSPSVRSLLTGSITSFVTGGSGTVSGDVFAPVRPPSVWERALGTPLEDLDALEPSQAINILTMKVDAAARTLFDGLGRDNVARLLAELRKRYRGTSFTVRDFERVAEEIGVDLPGLLGDWLRDASLPGFMASGVRTERLEDDAGGKPRYQLRVDVFNGEDVPGLFRLRYRSGDDPAVHESDPIRVPSRAAMEAGLVTQAPIHELWVAPYLSLNRHEFPLRVPETDANTTSDAAPLAGARPSEWRPTLGRGIVVDDLDPGFTATAPPPRDSSASGYGYDTDEGLPVYQRVDPVLEAHWSRQEQPTSWGRYRHTVVRVTPGEGDREATFSTVLPKAGRWRVDYFLPNLAVGYSTRTRSPFQLTASIEFAPPGSQGPQLGNYDMRISNGGSVHPVEFDASDAEPGWTTLGRFDLDAGEVSLVVTNLTNGRTVVADAVRWIPDAADG